MSYYDRHPDECRACHHEHCRCLDKPAGVANNRVAALRVQLQRSLEGGSGHYPPHDEVVAELAVALRQTLHARIARALGWTVPEAQSFSLAALRELLTHEPELHAEISSALASGSVVRMPA